MWIDRVLQSGVNGLGPGGLGVVEAPAADENVAMHQVQRGLLRVGLRHLRQHDQRAVCPGVGNGQRGLSQLLERRLDGGLVLQPVLRVRQVRQANRRTERLIRLVDLQNRSSIFPLAEFQVGDGRGDAVIRQFPLALRQLRIDRPTR